MKIGIITMHKVLNYGSALQAYALQYVIQQMGYDVELIDYDYPPKGNQLSFKTRFVDFFIGSPLKRQKVCFEEFYRGRFILSKNRYNRTLIKENPPQYDIYCTGSDQVWSPRFAKDDTTFMLDFVKGNAPKISYASSFATSVIPQHLCPLYTKHLSSYASICVREHQNVDTVKELTGRDAKVACDPTILMSSNDWQKIAKKHKRRPDKPYILVYILNYMFNVYPYADNILDYIKKTLKYDVVFLSGKTINVIKPGCICIKDASPEEFIDLFQHASFVLTDSFHGTAFSTIFQRPILGLVKDRNNSDGRLASLLTEVGAQNSIMWYKDSINCSREELLNLICMSDKLDSYRNNSLSLLKDMIQTNS